jgi:hypothetical protein
MEEVKELTVNKVALELDVGVKTVGNWYNAVKFYKDNNLDLPEGLPPLPEFRQDSHKGRRYWTVEAVEQLKVFQQSIPKGRNGCFGAFTRRFWGVRAEKIKTNTTNKEIKKDENKNTNI